MIKNPNIDQQYENYLLLKSFSNILLFGLIVNLNESKIIILQNPGMKKIIEIIYRFQWNNFLCNNIGLKSLIRLFYHLSKQLKEYIFLLNQ